MFRALLRTFQRGLIPVGGRFLPPVSALCSSSDLPAHTNLSDFQKSKLTSVFKRYLDLDDNNVIDWDDFRRSLINYKVMYKYTDEHPVYKRLVRQKQIAWSSMLRQMDGDMDGQLTIDEFFDSIARAIDGRTSLWDSPGWLRDWVNHGFEAVDTDGDECISLEDYKTYTNGIFDLNFDAEEIFKTLDTDKDGKITKEQWETLWNDFFFSQDRSKPGNYVSGPLEGSFVMQYV